MLCGGEKEELSKEGLVEIQIQADPFPQISVSRKESREF
jgi:hypothetical protein